MTLVSSGTIRMSDINVELGRSSTANISLDTAENGGYGAINTNSTSRPSSNNPAAMSEWYGYNHNATSGVVNIAYDITFSPTGGNCTINKNGVRVLRVTTNTVGTFTAAPGDEITTIIVSPTGGTRVALVDVFINGTYLGGNSGTVSTQFTFTALSNASYDISADAYNGL
jgi:hypothetical protein